MDHPSSPSRRRAVLARDHIAASRALALFAGAGGLWLLISGLTVPGFAGEGLRAVVTLGVGLAVALLGVGGWFGAARTPERALVVTAPASVLVIGALNLLTGDAGTGSQLFLLWPVLYTASFLSRRHTVVVLVEALVVEAVVMGALQAPSQAVVDTVSLVLAFSLAAFAVLTFRARVQLLLDALSSQAREDALTGLPNRRAFDDALTSLCALSHRTGEPLSLLFVDVDLFKEVNDTRGHAAGDQVLRAVASALRRSGREADVVARVGGDEFAMLLPSCPFDDATAIGLTLREFVIAQTARIGEPVTVSVGAATMPVATATADELTAAADAALYAGKLTRRADAGGALVTPG